MALSENLIDEPVLFLALSLMQECMVEELAKADGPTLCYAGQWLGNTPPPAGLLDCAGGKCGVAYVVPDAIYESTQFPLPSESQQGGSVCQAPMAMQFTMGVLRCRPQPQGKAMYPDPQAVFEANRLTFSDQYAMRKAILCCFRARVAVHENHLLRELQVGLGTWTPAPDTAGGAWTAYVGG
jgi:hypothetical protein